MPLLVEWSSKELYNLEGFYSQKVGTAKLFDKRKGDFTQAHPLLGEGREIRLGRLIAIVKL